MDYLSDFFAVRTGPNSLCSEQSGDSHSESYTSWTTVVCNDKDVCRPLGNETHMSSNEKGRGLTSKEAYSLYR